MRLDKIIQAWKKSWHEYAALRFCCNSCSCARTEPNELRIVRFGCSIYDMLIFPQESTQHNSLLLWNHHKQYAADFDDSSVLSLLADFCIIQVWVVYLYFKRNTPQLAANGIKGMRIQLRLRSAWPGSNFMRQRLGCPAACGGGALPPFRMKNPKN